MAQKKISSIDDEYRINLSLNAAGQISASMLDSLVVDIKQKHSVALYRMRNYLNKNIVAALNGKGVLTRFDNNGFISVTNHSGTAEYKIWATPRPPKVNDYHYSDISNPIGEKVIVGPKFMEEKREILNSWLSGKSVVEFYNEGEILNLVKLIHP